MNERLKELRKTLGYSQREFGDKLGLSRDVISNLELGRVDLKEHIIKLICEVFNVNEQWLRIGQGEMFLKLSREDEITQWLGSLVKPDNNNEFMKKFVHMLSKLDIEDWKVLEKMALMMIDEKEDARQKPSK